MVLAIRKFGPDSHGIDQSNGGLLRPLNCVICTGANKMGALSGHPRGLYMLFFAEMWERFSYYGMRALLVLYMTQGFLKFPDKNAFAVYGAYTSLVYASPIIGGLLADQILGYRRAIILGGSLMAAGHLLMTQENSYMFFTALALIICGNGFFKPNISSLVGKLYGEGDPKRDAGFTIFYMGINLGAGLAPILCGIAADYFGRKTMVDGKEVIEKAFHYGFGLATIGMIMGLIVFTLGQNVLGDKGLPPNREKLAKWGIPIYISSIVVAPMIAILLQYGSFVGYLLIGFGVLTLSSLIGLALKEERVPRQRMFVIFSLMFFHMIFWAFFEQAGSSLTLFAERNVNRTFMGSEIPTATLQAVNPVFIWVFGPLLASLWVSLANKKKDPAAPYKFALGIFQLGLGFGLIWLSTLMADSSGKTMLLFLILGYLGHTTGELCISPVGLSTVTKMAPVRIVGLMMGAWFLSNAFANYLAGMIAALTGVEEGGGKQAETATAVESLAVYGDVFGKIAISAVVVSLLCLVLAPFLTKMMHLDKLAKGLDEHLTDVHEELA
jgi:POT family proton-dependent oligopeptide transporter